MTFEIIWHPKAEITLQDEMNFILAKWNQQEVLKFYTLVLENLDRLAINPRLGKFENKLKVYCMPISKQTTLYYDFDTSTQTLQILLFWNNQRNPKELMKILER